MPQIEYLIASLDLGANFLFLAPSLPIAVMSVPCETLASFNFMWEPCASPRDKIKRIKIIHKSHILKNNFLQIEFGDVKFLW